MEDHVVLTNEVEQFLVATIHVENKKGGVQNGQNAILESTGYRLTMIKLLIGFFFNL